VNVNSRGVERSFPAIEGIISNRMSLLNGTFDLQLKKSAIYLIYYKYCAYSSKSNWHSQMILKQEVKGYTFEKPSKSAKQV
jgi:hypothetical protein